MSDTPRLLGRIGGTTSLPTYATKVKDANGPEPERVDEETEDRLAASAEELSKALRERGQLIRKQEERRKRLRVLLTRYVGRKDVAKMSSVRCCARALKRDKKRITDLDAKVGRLESERRTRLW